MTPEISRSKGLRVREKILIIFLALSLISLLITGMLAFVTINRIGNYAEQSLSELGKDAVNDSTVALKNEAEINLMRIASDQAQITQLSFDDTAAEIDILAAQAVSLQNNPPLIPSTPSFTINNQPPNPLSGTVVFLAPGSTATPQSDEYRTLAGMDDLLKAMKDADTDLKATYIATDSGIIRMYPWTSQHEAIYDPRIRLWFTNAKKSSGHVWSGPYVGATDKSVMFTCSRAIPTKYGTWVVASDVTVDTINANFENLMLDSNGYAVMVDSEGNVITSPDLTAGNTKWYEAFQTKNIFNNSNPEMVKIGRKMVDGESGIAHFWIDDDVYKGKIYIAYAPVKSLNWSFAISVPALDIIEPAVKTGIKIEIKTREISDNVYAQTTQMLQILVGLFFILLIAVILLSVKLAKIITRPVELLRQGTVALGKGDLEYHLTIETGDEFEELAHSFNVMARDLKTNIENLRLTTADKERYAKEMEIAKEIQDNFLPEFTPTIPGIELAATTLPAMEIGGDLYDFIPVQKELWGLAIADVSGKGVSAALFMALCSTVIRVSGGAEADPSVVLERANQLIYADGRSSMFITIFYGVLDPANRKFTYVNAGHNPPMLVRGDPISVRTLEEGRGIALGVVPEVKIKYAELVLEPDDLIVMYTDGITEAFNPENEEFGEERLMDYLKNHRNDSVQEIIDGLVDEVRRFCGSRPQSDDITLVIVRVK
ncbi:MAG: SpoIIE family protein phosphatase [Methanoregula sp.]|nr:SpoIIE family protein phosphatase [Methanoregula sp.]